MNTVERRERLIRILMLRGKTSIKTLAGELEVSERTVMRDIDVLSTSRPISTLPGKGGGVFITDTYEINRPRLQEYEITLLKKIISEIELKTSCSLSSSEVQALKDMLTSYTTPQNTKGKKI